MPPIAMVEKFEAVYLLVGMIHLSEKMQEQHKYSCGTFEGLNIVPEDMVIAVKLKRKAKASWHCRDPLKNSTLSKRI